MLNKTIVGLCVATSVILVSCKEEKKTAELPAAPRGNVAIQAEGFIVKERVLSENIEVPGSLLPFEET